MKLTEQFTEIINDNQDDIKNGNYDFTVEGLIQAVKERDELVIMGGEPCSCDDEGCKMLKIIKKRMEESL